MAGVPTFTIDVPKKSAAGEAPIARMIVDLDVETESSAQFTVTAPSGGAFAFAATSPGSATQNHEFVAAWSMGMTANTVLLKAPSAIGVAGDPSRRRYSLYFLLDGDIDPNLQCVDLTPGPTTAWTIAVTGNNILTACVFGQDKLDPVVQCVGSYRNVPASEPVPNIDPASAPPQGCSSTRAGVDVVLVLDKSGSMAAPSLGGDLLPKINHLQQAVKNFVTRWDTLLTAELGQGLTPADKIAVELFDSSATAWSSIPDALDAMDSGHVLANTIESNVTTITPGTSTSIGAGVLRALTTITDFADNTRRRVILVMTDGLQNTDPMIGVRPTDGLAATHLQSDPLNATALPHLPNFQIYYVTVGTGAAVDPTVSKAVAAATNGFYINTETDAALMTPFFLELLGVFVKFSSWDIDRLVHATASRSAPYVTTIPFTSTTRNVGFSVNWPADSGPLMLTVTPPGEKNPTVTNGFESIISDFTLPTSADYDRTGVWQVRVEPGFFDDADERGRRPAAEDFAIPFDLTVLSEDSAFHSDLRVVPGNYAPGDQVQFEVRLTEFGQGLTGLGTQPDDRLLVEVVKPGNGVGDLLATSTAPTTQPFASDPATNANAKLFNQLQADPASLQHLSGDVVTLTDAGDGLYQGAYTVQTPGHYNFLFGIEGGTRNLTRFSRQRLESVYVRPLPVTSTTTSQASFVNAGGGIQLSIILTPRTSGGNLLGPGWANYLWYQAPGQTPVKPVDHMNGTYTATIPVTSPTSLLATLHFIDVAMVIGDDCLPENLPISLDDSNVLVSPSDQIVRCVRDKFDLIEDFIEARIPGFENFEKFLQSLF